MNEITIDLREAAIKQGLHYQLAVKLGFPDWYGNNRDAFWDVIRDPDIVVMPDRLILLGFKEFSEKFPKDAEIFWQLLLDLKQEYPSLSCEVIYS